MEITLELTDEQILNLIHTCSFELSQKYPDMRKNKDENLSKLFRLLDNAVKDEEKLAEIKNTLLEYMKDIKITHSKTGIYTGLKLARGKIDIT